MDRYIKERDEETHIPVWLIILVGLAVLGVLAALLVFFFASA